jgi:hypothetical protein
MTHADDIAAPGGDYEFDTDDDLDIDDDEYDFGDEDTEAEDPVGEADAEEQRAET